MSLSLPPPFERPRLQNTLFSREGVDSALEEEEEEEEGVEGIGVVVVGLAAMATTPPPPPPKLPSSAGAAFNKCGLMGTPDRVL